MKALLNILIILSCTLGFTQEKSDERIIEIEQEIQVALEKEDYEKAAELKKEKEYRLQINEAVAAGNYQEAARLKKEMEETISTVPLKVGDTVSFKELGETKVGEITAIEGDKAKVMPATGIKLPRSFTLSELTKILPYSSSSNESKVGAVNQSNSSNYVKLDLPAEAVEVVQMTQKIGSSNGEELLYGFAKGDKVIIQINEQENKELKEIEFKQYGASGTSLFKDFKATAVNQKTVEIAETGIYSLIINNSSMTKRVCNISIYRIPESDETSDFNTTVYWKTEYDTTYFTTQERYLKRKEYVPKTIISPSEHYINSGSNATVLGGKSRITVPITLPKNTQEFYYQFSAYRNESQMKKTQSAFNLLGELSKLIDQTGSISFGIDLLTQPPGGNYCDVYLFDFENSNAFLAKNTFNYLTVGTRENFKSGVVKVTGGAGDTFYLGFRNPSGTYGIHIAFEVVAIVLEEEYGTRPVQHTNVSSRRVAYLRN